MNERMQLQKEYSIESKETQSLEEDSEIGRELDRVEAELGERNLELRSHVNDVDLLSDNLSPQKLELHSTLEYPVQKRIFGLPKPSNEEGETQIGDLI